MDNFFASRIFRREATQQKPSAGQQEAEQPSKGGSFQDNAVMVRTQRAALNVPAFARAIQVIADTMSQCVMQYQKFDKNKKNFVPDMANKGISVGLRMNYLCQVQPNPRQTWVQLIKQATHNMYFKGNAYIWIERDEGGQVRAFWLCQSGTYDYISDTYNLQYDNLGSRTLSGVRSEDVIHLRSQYSNDNGKTGVPIFDYAWSCLSLAATNDKQALENSAKGGRMKLLLQEDKQQGFGLGKASKKELEKITKQMNEDVYNKDVIMLNNVASVTPISQSATDMSLLDMRKFSVRDVARITGVPAILLMDDSNSTYKSPEAATQEFLQRCIAPLVKQYEDEFNAKIIGFEGFGVLRFHFCVDPLWRLDPKGQAELDEKRLQTGWSVNELRGQYDLPSLEPEQGDKHYISTNLAELGSEKLSGTTPSQPSPSVQETDNNNNSPEGGQGAQKGGTE